LAEPSIRPCFANEICERLFYCRESAPGKPSQSKVAEALEVRQSYISKSEVNPKKPAKHDPNPSLAYIEYAVLEWNVDANYIITGREPKFLGEEIRGAPSENQGEGDTGGETVDKLKQMKAEEVRDIFHSAADQIFFGQNRLFINDFIDRAMKIQMFETCVKHELEKRRNGNPSLKKADIVKEGSG
jgi:hypothetical protein